MELKEGPKKAYLVSSGEYSDYQVAEVFLDKAAAERYCALHNADGKNCDPCYIEEYDINDGSKIDTSEQVLWYYYMRVNIITYGPEKGELETGINFDFSKRYHPHKLVFGNEDRQPNTWEIVEERRGYTLLGYRINIYLDHEDNALASKIAQDRWNEFKAELEGVKL